MTTFARIVDGVAVEVGVQDYPPVQADSSPDPRWIEVPDGVGVGHLFDGKQWTAPERVDPAPTPTLEGRMAALETRLAALEGKR